MTKLNRPVTDMDVAELQSAALQVDIATHASRLAIAALSTAGERTWITVERLGDHHPAVLDHVENLIDKGEVIDRLIDMYGAKTWAEWIALLMVEPVPADAGEMAS